MHSYVRYYIRVISPINMISLINILNSSKLLFVCRCAEKNRLKRENMTKDNNNVFIENDLIVSRLGEKNTFFNKIYENLR